jgi:hypothetical protein
MAAPNIQKCASHVLTRIEAISAPNGGYLKSILNKPW